ncbi:MAG: lytic transglycosylase domain-containing protein [Treponema sp.]|jgi:soluble lytic murein transglycosylase|nr:lytic transglycosylase domain-containing protein [Treponema sp.]
MVSKTLTTLFQEPISLFRPVKNLAVIAGLSLFLLSCCGVTLQAAGNKDYGADRYYFAGLEELKNKTAGPEPKKKARYFFNLGSRKANPVIAKKSMEELMTFGPLKERVKAARQYVSRWDDSESLLPACQVFFEAEDYREIIKLTGALDRDAPAELVRLRLISLLRYNRPEFQTEIAGWFLSSPITDAHIAFLKECALPQELTAGVTALIQVRLEVYRKNYTGACALLDSLRAEQTDEAVWLASLPESVFSDAGKALFYGNSDNRENAFLFDRAAQAASGRPLAYYALFYAGRFYDRIGEKNTLTAASRFWKAADTAPDADKKDDALWYYLSTLLAYNPDEVIQELARRRLEFHDKNNFFDFFDTLALTLLKNKQWEAFYTAAGLLPGIADSASVSKFAYIAGRLLESGLFLPSFIPEPAKEAERFFRAACIPGASPYYMLLAAAKLNLSAPDVETLLMGVTKAPVPAETTAFMRRLLTGYADFGFSERIYPEWRKIRNSLDADAAFNAALFLQSGGDEVLQRQGLLVASYTLGNLKEEHSRDQYRLAYPRFFRPEIEKACAEFALPDYVMYSLVRSESFFERQVTSSAGAEGLSQLMRATADDIAQRLKIQDYDIYDGETNIRFGAFYLADLIRRFEGAALPAVCAYNAGASRVRSWLRASPDLPPDLFLEIVPYRETRNYGRNVLTAAALYGWLYADIPPAQIVHELLGFTP